MIRQTFHVFILGFLLFHTASPQESRPLTSRHAVYLELLGPGGLYSVNYDFRIIRGLSVRVGFTAWSFPALVVATAEVTAFPFMVSGLIGGRRANLELGIGLMPGTAASTELFTGGTIVEGNFLVGITTIGYRHQSVDGGFLFRIGFTPFFGYGEFVPYGGLSLGHSF